MERIRETVARIAKTWTGPRSSKTDRDVDLEPGEPMPLTCPGCGGWLRFLRHECERGGVQWCYPGDRCDECRSKHQLERQETRAGQLLKASRIPEELRGYHFDRVAVQAVNDPWDLFFPRVIGHTQPQLGVAPWNRQRYEQLKAWRPGQPNIWLYGPTGSGKSLLAATLAQELLREGVDVVWWIESQYYDAAWRRGEAGQETRERARAAQVLFLDEMGAKTNFKQSHRDEFEQLVIGRAARNMIVTSNLPLTSEVLRERYGDRVMSRLVGACKRKQLRLGGYDWRTGRKHREASDA